jgi:hypothetical protein
MLLNNMPAWYVDAAAAALTRQHLNVIVLQHLQEEPTGRTAAYAAGHTTEVSNFSCSHLLQLPVGMS